MDVFALPILFACVVLMPIIFGSRLMKRMFERERKRLEGDGEA